MDLNLAVIAGTLAAPPEIRTFDSGSRLARYLVTIRSTEPRKRVDVVPVVSGIRRPISTMKPSIAAIECGLQPPSSDASGRGRRGGEVVSRSLLTTWSSPTPRRNPRSKIREPGLASSG